MIKDNLEAMDGREVTFARPAPVFLRRAMKESNIRAISEGPDRSGEFITCSLCDLINLPFSRMEENAAYRPA